MIISEEEIIKRRMLIKSQAIQIFRQERKAMKRRLFLLKEKARVEREITDSYIDPVLSKKLEAIMFLLANNKISLKPKTH